MCPAPLGIVCLRWLCSTGLALTAEALDATGVALAPPNRTLMNSTMASRTRVRRCSTVATGVPARREDFFDGLLSVADPATSPALTGP